MKKIRFSVSAPQISFSLPTPSNLYIGITRDIYYSFDEGSRTPFCTYKTSHIYTSDNGQVLSSYVVDVSFDGVPESYKANTGADKLLPPHMD